MIFVCALIALFGGFHAAEAHAQPPVPKKKPQVTVPYDGPEIFARLLDHAGLEPIASLDRFEVDAAADKTILIVFGDPSPLLELEKKPGGVGGFLQRGGALFVATDRPFSLGQLPSLGWNGVQFNNNGAIYLTQTYENNARCPMITLAEISHPEHPLFRDVTKPIATNCPGFITAKIAILRRDDLGEINRDLQALAVLPLGPVRAQFQSRPYLAASKAEAPRTLLAAGHGVFMNCMTIRENIDNRRLALNAIEWLKDGKRTHVLFVNEGKVVENFKMPLVGPPKSPIPSMAAINRVIDAIQNEQLLQKILDRAIGPERMVRGLIILTTFAILFYGIKKYFQSRWSLEATPAILGVPPPDSPPLVKQQLREMVRRQQLGEPAQALARDWFRTYAKIDFPAGQPPSELSFDIHAGLFQRRKLVEHVETLWKLASEPSPADWDSKKLRTLAVFLEELSLSVLAGEVVFDAPVAAVARS